MTRLTNFINRIYVSILSSPSRSLAYPLQHKAKALSLNERGLSLPRIIAGANVYRVAGGGFEPPTFGL
jgi:hypothetical protein